MGFGEAIAYGAASIINAIATGKGAAFGVDLWTKARVKLTGTPGKIAGKILNEPKEKTTLIENAALTVLKHFKLEKEFGAKVETESNIPIARGMKSSSVAANAVVLATAAAIGKKMNEKKTIELAVNSAITAKTTITGAYDDACASFFGDIVITDNYERRILKRYKAENDFRVLFHIPAKKSYTYTSDVEAMKIIAPHVEVAFKEAKKGNYWTALTLNGLLYSAVLGYNSHVAIKALRAGAIASGLTGKGPATTAITTEDNTENIVRAWAQFNGRIIRSNIKHEKAHVTRSE